MAFTFSNVTGLDHGILLDIVFTKGVRDNISQDFAEFVKFLPVRLLAHRVLLSSGSKTVSHFRR